MRSCAAAAVATSACSKLWRAFAAAPFFPPRVEQRSIPNVQHVILVGSGKGGVGKSTVAANIACSLVSQCHVKVGLLDADVSGPSIPRMMNLLGKQAALTNTEPAHLLPLSNHGVQCMSMGFLVAEGKALTWRGPMVGKALEQMLFGVVWGALDVLVVDLPPGTGDTHITLAQRLRSSGAVMVTTPQEVALSDVKRSLQMFQQVKIPVLGVVENMSYFECDGCGKRTHVFGEQGGARLATQEGVDLLGQLPLDPVVMTGGEKGAPASVAHADRAIGKEYAAVAKALCSKLGLK
eukprot:TRINITY_DN7249_c0_g1_i1.p1 TRINITY_DN7249_c0_g1~~TRINITY_DN7249_c0_g1_i1.p1  ORF type:complete len:311 (-),score=24.62 TRINITY_DN7249_c0_g1_i1:431-1309(-)